MLVMTLHKLPRTEVSGAAARVPVVLLCSVCLSTMAAKVMLSFGKFVSLGGLRTLLQAGFLWQMA